MFNVALNPLTKLAIETVLGSKQRIFALVGPYGAGKGYLASSIAEDLIGTDGSSSNIFQINTEGAAIGIDQIRLIQSRLKLKVPGPDEIRRVIIIENAQLMTIEAQNAFLKTLEEPPSDTCIILTISIRSMLLPTVLSRLMLIDVLPLTIESCRQLAKSINKIDQDVEKAILISGGHAALFLALLNEPDHDLVKAITTAKSMLRADIYNRLISAGDLFGNKENTELFLFGLKRVLSAAARNSVTPAQEKSIAQKLQHVYRTEMALTSNPNHKLLMTNLAINI